MISNEFDERFKMAIINMVAGKPYEARVAWLAYIINALANLEGAGDCHRTFTILADCAKKLDDEAISAQAAYQ